ncbi:syntaxin-7-like isoform X1 [Ylistrum balloti]|uniref:syntaxin-7-like isoform X1 n=1 Tax=Ylistrum balloti TaxID=509963 RepID=UPI002905E50C|nr:syntaxin-7-like isoform X1 [Ylistrum balloti]XP_060072606.1 syntaxin-7-like isoform X1 [Ylistrum balloti]
MASYGRGEFDGGFSSYQTGSRSSAGGSSEFNRLVNSISGNIQKISQHVAQMQRAVNQIGSSQDSDRLREQMHQAQTYTNQLAKDTNHELKELAHLPMPASEQSKWRMQRDRLTDEFSNALKNFQTVQRSAAEKEKASVARARAHSSSTTPGFNDFSDIRPEEQQAAPGFSQTRQILQMEEDVDLEMLQEREDSIKKLERDIVDVNQIFKDLGMLVHEQGEMLDSIEANVESAQIRVEEGTQQLSKARDYQSKARRKKCICIVILLVVLAVIAIIIAIYFSQKN